MCIIGLLCLSVFLFNKIKKSKRLVDHLLKELKHRTTGNFQTIYSLIGIKKDEMDDSPKQTLELIQGRVQSMGILHELLNNNSKGNVDMQQYITDVIGNPCIGLWYKYGTIN